MWDKMVAALGRGIKSKGGQWFAAVMASLGLAVATQTIVVAPALDSLMDYMQSVTSSGSGQFMLAAVQLVAYVEFDKAVTMVMSAYAARASIRAARAYLTKKA